jgi:hypothetical protein
MGSAGELAFYFVVQIFLAWGRICSLNRFGRYIFVIVGGAACDIPLKHNDSIEPHLKIIK